MVNKLGKYEFGNGAVKIDLCPLCLGELKGSAHKNCFPKGTIVVKKENYALLKVSRDEAIVKRMLKISNNENDDSKEFIIFYLDKTLVGYKGKDKIKFIPGFSNEKYEQILKNYAPRSERQKNNFETMWRTSNSIRS